MKLTDEQLHNMVYKAYKDARRHKINTFAQLNFEIFCEHDLENIYNEIRNRKYVPLPAFCFITFDPVQREVYASQFRDRVVQHLLFNMINPLFDTLMIYDTYSCRKEKGTLFGVERYEHHLRSVTNNFTREAWVLYIDLSGYFMSIDKKLVINIVMEQIYKKMDCKSVLGGYWRDHIDPDLVLFLLHAFLDRNPADDCIKIGKPSDWNGLPDRKKLECSPDGHGIVIGDIISQLLSNILLNVYDQWIKRVMHVKHHGHYVDDMYDMHQSKGFLEKLLPQAVAFLEGKLHLKINLGKCKLLRANYAITFLGAYIRPYYKVPRQRTIDNFTRKMRELEKQLLIFPPACLDDLMDVRNRINAYCGLTVHYKAYRLRRKYLENPAFFHYFVFDRFFKRAIIRPEFLNMTDYKYKDVWFDNNIMKPYLQEECDKFWYRKSSLRVFRLNTPKKFDTRRRTLTEHNI